MPLPERREKAGAEPPSQRSAEAWAGGAPFSLLSHHLQWDSSVHPRSFKEIWSFWLPPIPAWGFIQFRFVKDVTRPLACAPTSSLSPRSSSSWSLSPSPLSWSSKSFRSVACQGDSYNYKNEFIAGSQSGVQEYERTVIFRLGRLLSGGARGPGVFFIIPCVDIYEKIDLRVQNFDVPPQEVSWRSGAATQPNELHKNKYVNLQREWLRLVVVFIGFIGFRPVDFDNALSCWIAYYPAVCLL